MQHQSPQKNPTQFKEIENLRIKLEGQYDGEGLYQGTHRFWDGNRRIVFEAEFTDGLQTSARQFFPNGKTESEKHFKNGLPHGPQKTWHPGGEIKSEANYESGKLHGKQKKYFASGQVKSEQMYEYGNLTDSKEWSVSGELI